jgi:transcriptional regulator with XRE-family HTH domain
MAFDKNALKKRNMEIGQMLEQARTSKGLLMAECASVIGTTRQRYGAIERGESFVTAVELELLLRFLDIRHEEVWPEQAKGDMGRRIRRLPVTISPDETLHVVVDISG